MQLTSLYLHAWKNVAYYNIFKDKISVLAWLSKQPHNRNPGDGDSWTMTSSGHLLVNFCRHFCPREVPFLGEFSRTLFG